MSDRTHHLPTHMYLEHVFVQKPIVQQQTLITPASQYFMVGFDWQGDYHLYRGKPGQMIHTPALKNTVSSDADALIYTTPRGILYTENRIVTRQQPAFYGSDFARPCTLVELFGDQRELVIQMVRSSARNLKMPRS